MTDYLSLKAAMAWGFSSHSMGKTMGEAEREFEQLNKEIGFRPSWESEVLRLAKLYNQLNSQFYEKCNRKNEISTQICMRNMRHSPSALFKLNEEYDQLHEETTRLMTQMRECRADLDVACISKITNGA